MIQLCVDKLRILIEDSDQNLKYLGLLSMINILGKHSDSWNTGRRNIWTRASKECSRLLNKLRNTFAGHFGPNKTQKVTSIDFSPKSPLCDQLFKRSGAPFLGVFTILYTEVVPKVVNFFPNFVMTVLQKRLQRPNNFPVLKVPSSSPLYPKALIFDQVLSNRGIFDSKNW